MFNIRRLTLLALVAFIATTTYARPAEDDTTYLSDIDSPDRQKSYELFPITEQCRTAANKYNYSECLISLNSYIHKPIKDKDIPKLETVCNNRDRCSIDRVNAAMDEIEKNCGEDLKHAWPEAVDVYQMWTALPYRYAAQCTKVGDKYCAVETFHGVNCDDCQRAMANAVMSVKFDRKSVFISNPVTNTLRDSAEKNLKICGTKNTNSGDTEEDTDKGSGGIIVESDGGDEDESSATSLYINILGTSLVVLSAIVLSQ
jgi:hypothetical protein